MISIDGIILSNDLVWVNEFDSPVVAQNIVTTLGGRDTIQIMGITPSRIITLSTQQVGKSFSGYFTRAQVIQLKTVEASTNTVLFVYESQSIYVKLLAGMLKVKPLIARPNQATTDWYNGSITMKEVA